MSEQDQSNNPLFSEQKKTKYIKALRVVNIAFAILVVVLAIFSAVVVVIDSLTTLRFFLILSPVYLSIFSLLLLAAQFKIRFILKKMPFLRTALGKGLFYLYLSSILYYYFQVAGYTFLAWFGAISMLASALIYLAIHFGCSKGITQEDLSQNYESTYKQRLI